MDFLLKYLIWITIFRTSEAKIIPLDYTIRIWSSLESQFFSGSSKIHIAVVNTTRNTRNINLNSGPNLRINYIESKIYNETYNMTITRHYYDNEMLSLTINHVLEAGKKYILDLKFFGKLEKTDKGFYRGYYMNYETGEPTWYTATQFEMKLARRAFPCFDHPSLKTPFTIHIIHSKKYNALSNMPLIRRVPRLDSNLVDSYFETSPPMSTYMVAFFVSDFEYVNCSESDTKLRIWTRKAAISQAQFICPKIPEMVKYLKTFFRMDFPLPKLDIVAINEIRPNIVNSWGILFYEEFKMLMEEPSLIQSKNLVAQLAGQISKQWFSNSFLFSSLKPWWIFDGIGMFLGYKYVMSSTESKQNILSLTYFKEQTLFGEITSPEIQRHTEGKKISANRYYTSRNLTYAMYFFYMLNSMLGEEKFSGSIHRFLQDCQFNCESENDFWQLFNTNGTLWKSQLGETNFTSIANSWFSHVHIPYIFIKRNYENSTVKIIQRKVIENKIEDDCAWIPLTFTTSVERNFSKGVPTYWSSCQKPNDELKFPNLTSKDWIMSPRVDFSLTRINYDEQTWELICTDLFENQMNPIPKEMQAELISSAIFFGGLKQISEKILTKLFEYVQHHDNGDILETLFPKFRRITSSCFEQYSKSCSQNLKFLTPIRNLIKGVADRIANQAAGNENQRRIQVFLNNEARLYRVNDEAEAGQFLFKEWMRNPEKRNPIDVDYRETVYCVALQRGGEAEYNFLLHQFQKANEQAERMRIFNVLKCSIAPEFFSAANVAKSTRKL